MASSFVAALSSVTAVAFSFVASLLARSAQDLYKGLFGSFLESIDVLVGQAPKRHRTVDTAYRLPVPTPSQVAKERALARIEEAKDAFRSQTSSAKWSKVSGNLLAVGQYIIGGLLREFIRAGVPLPEARRFSWTARAPRLPHQAILSPRGQRGKRAKEGGSTKGAHSHFRRSARDPRREDCEWTGSYLCDDLIVDEDHRPTHGNRDAGSHRADTGASREIRVGLLAPP